MIIRAWAPTRISLFGGGSDLPVFYEHHERGLVISMAINLYQRMEYSDKRGKWSIPAGAKTDFYTETFKYLGIEKPKSLVATYDGYIEGGLGTSASAAVTMAEIVRRLKQETTSRKDLAEKAWDVEVNKRGLYGGKQDQYAVALGGLNTICFRKDGIVSGDQWEKFRSENLVNQLLLFHTGENRKETRIQEQLLVLDKSKVDALGALVLIAEAAIGYFWVERWLKIAELLDQSWQYKKLSNPKVSTERIDELYAKAKEVGAVGGKLCGSGGGGYMVFMGPPEKHGQITHKLVSLGCESVDFGIDWSGVSSRIIEL